MQINAGMMVWIFLFFPNHVSFSRPGCSFDKLALRYTRIFSPLHLSLNDQSAFRFYSRIFNVLKSFTSSMKITPGKWMLVLWQEGFCSTSTRVRTWMGYFGASTLFLSWWIQSFYNFVKGAADRGVQTQLNESV